MDIQSTSDASQEGLKFLVHGPAGAGKTYMARTCDGPTLILSCEAGLASLMDVDMDAVAVDSMDDLVDAYKHLAAGDHDYEWVVLDSISEMAEVCLAEELDKATDPRQAYGELANRMTKMIRLFRSLDLHIYFSAKQTRDKVDGRLLFTPYMPGNKLSSDRPIAHDFDYVFSLVTETDEDGSRQRLLVTQRDEAHEAKARDPYDCLDAKEEADLGKIREKLSQKQS